MLSPRVSECPLGSRADTPSKKTQSPQRIAENRRDRIVQIDSVMRVSSHRFQTKVTISVPLRCSARPRSSSLGKKRARTSTGRLRCRPHRTCSVERLIVHYDGDARETLAAALGGGSAKSSPHRASSVEVCAPRSLRFHGPRPLRARQLRDRGVGRLGSLWLRPEALSFQGLSRSHGAAANGLRIGRMGTRVVAANGSPGFTMLELLLVMALIVTISAMVMPNIGQTLASHRLRAAGQQVRTAWGKARVRAMDNGRTFAFRHEPSGNRYVVEPWLQQDDYLESSDLTMNGAPMAGVGTETSRVIVPIVENLPESIKFVVSESVEDSRAFVASQLGSSVMQTDEQWSAPIFFYPDGTTSTSRVQLTNTRNGAIEVTMRGLTGVVAVKEIFLDESMLP
jgi:prepilin-type N-terminal cleavage/methylation domain-containing protein